MKLQIKKDRFLFAYKRKVLLLPRIKNQKENESMNLFTYAYYFFFYFYFSQKVEREFVCIK